jgi:hypothetical protein
LWKNLPPMPTGRSLWFAVTGIAVLALLVTIQPRQPRHEAGFDQPGAASWHDLQRRVPTGGGEMPAMYERASTALSRLERFASRINRSIPAAQPAARVWFGDDRLSPLSLLDRSSATGVLDAWTPLGPGNIGGRTRVVKFHPAVSSTIFAAGVSGGLWKSDDNGTTWRPAGDGLTNIAINALAIDPQRPDVMYAGTGEGYFREEIRGTGLPLRGSGIFITRNGGGTWQQLDATRSPDFYWVNDLELGVADKQRIYAATRTGVWRSNDGGTTWTRLLEVNVRGGCLDLALRPDRTEDVLFASCGSYEQATVYRFPNAATRSDAEVVLREANMGRTSLAIAPSNPDVMYALSASNSDGPNGNYRQALLAVYRSDRGGTSGSWTARVTNQDPTHLHTLLLSNAAAGNINACNPNATNSFTNMGWYINVIAVDPRDAERVWAAGVDWFRSDDGGRTWGLASTGGSGAAYAHVDQHAITFHPGYDGSANQVVLIGNDGGVFRSANARAATATGTRATCSPANVSVNWTSLNRGYGVTQFYHGTPFPDGTRYIGGTQDNGTIYGADDLGADGWRPVYGGDGGFSAVSPAQTNTWLMEYQWANVGRTVNGGTTVTPSTSGLDPVVSDLLGPDGNYLFVTPFTLDTVANRVWLGGHFLFRGNNFGASWVKAGSAMPDNGRVSAIAVSPSSNAVIVSGTHKGDIVRTEVTSDTSVVQLSTRPRDGWVTSIAFDPRNTSTIYATYGNFGGAHVLRSTDGGARWSSIDGSGSTGVPDIPVHSIVVDPDDSLRLYLGTDLGVMVSIDGGRTWMAEETGFGPAVTMWLSVVKVTGGPKYLFAFTHGRGAWRVRLP